MLVGTATEIWQRLEKQFSFNDGSRKYKLNKDTYEITQSGCSVGKYYTKMKCVWKELDNINVLPVITVVTPEISVFLAALNKQKEEQRLFQILNGLEDHFSHQRSQILIIDPFPTLLSKGIVKDKCSICGFKWHPPEKCWEKVGYPSWTAAHVESGNITFTPRQFKQLLKSVQQMNQFSAEEEIDHHQFVAGIACLNSHLDLLELLKDRIYDIGASNHMTPVEDNVFDPYQLKIKPHIRLSNGDISVISHVGNVKLNNCILLKDVLVLCVVQDLTTKKATRLGRLKEGLYHLVNVPANKVDSVFSSLVRTSLQKFSLSGVGNKSAKDSCGGTWIYFLEQKFDSFEALKSFIKFVTTQFEKKVKIVRSDKALEFVKGQCGPYLASQGIKDPVNFNEAIADPGWCAAMDVELKALEENGIWELTVLPAGKKAIGSHWILTKLKADGTEERKKARLVVQGWFTCQMDVSNAFFRGDLFEEVYMKPSLGYTSKGDNISDVSSLDSQLVCKLKRSLYGLKQAPRQWFFKLYSALLDFGYTQSKTDYSLFVKKEGTGFTVVLVYVDDLLITGNDESQINSLKAQLSSVFHMKDLGE
ncbi:cysteine-rich receptor-like protein kinase 8 [Tanacetum coccineum]